MQGDGCPVVMGVRRWVSAMGLAKPIKDERRVLFSVKPTHGEEVRTHWQQHRQPLNTVEGPVLDQAEH
jgi:hypothetical protein